MKRESIQTYWAAAPATEIAANILDKVDRYYEFLQESGRLDLYKKSYAAYYLSSLNGARINYVGSQGELSSLQVNQYRSILSHLEVLTTSQRPAFECRAANTDVQSQSQVILGQSLLDYYMQEKNLESYIRQAVKDSLVFAEAFISKGWNATSGEPYGYTESGAVINNGDIEYRNFTPLDCIRDFTCSSPNQEIFKILRYQENKHSLASKYPDIKDDILNDSMDLSDYLFTTSFQSGRFESDNIFVYELRHEVTPALPNGRLTLCLDNGTVLADGPLPYDKINVDRICPDENTGSIFGYTVGFDLLPIQEALNICYSTATTNISTFGVQNIITGKGSDISVSQIAGGLNLLEVDVKAGMIPQALQLTQTAPETYNFMGMLEQLMQTLSGVNSVVRGNPEASLKSGAALALVQSMAVQFSASLQQSYARLLQNVGQGTIDLLKTFATVPRIAAIAGKSNQPLMREFTGQDLSGIQRVLVDMGNPLLNTTAGKLNLADALMEKGMIDSPNEYIQVLTTGRLEPVIQGKQSQNLLIKAENEGLSNGQPQRALITDNHQQHIVEHTSVLSNPSIRQDANNPIVANTLAHIQEHMDMMSNPMVQQLSQILNQENVPSQAPQGPSPAIPNQFPAPQAQLPSMPNPPQGASPELQSSIQDQTQQLADQPAVAVKQ